MFNCNNFLLKKHDNENYETFFSNNWQGFMKGDIAITWYFHFICTYVGLDFIQRSDTNNQSKVRIMLRFMLNYH